MSCICVQSALESSVGLDESWPLTQAVLTLFPSRPASYDGHVLLYLGLTQKKPTKAGGD